MSLEQRLIWIMGSPRSGSTWLLRLLVHPWRLGRTPSGVDQPLLARAGPNAVPVNESYLPHHLGPIRELSPGDPGEGRRWLVNDLRSADPAYFFSETYEHSWRPALRDLVLARFEAQADRAAAELGLDDPIVVIKEPNGSHAAELVAELLPESRLIFLLRDGRDVIDSMLDADAPGGWRTRTEGVRAVAGEGERLDYVRRQAQLWLIRTEAVERARELIGPERSTLVRYEELLADPEAELARLDAFCGISRSERTIAAAVRANRFGSLRNRARGGRKGVRAASPGLWRQNLSEAEQAAVSELIGPTLERLGYAA